jgi:hypothetical protein
VSGWADVGLGILRSRPWRPATRTAPPAHRCFPTRTSVLTAPTDARSSRNTTASVVTARPGWAKQRAGSADFIRSALMCVYPCQQHSHTQSDLPPQVGDRLSSPFPIPAQEAASPALPASPLMHRSARCVIGVAFGVVGCRPYAGVRQVACGVAPLSHRAWTKPGAGERRPPAGTCL